MIQKSLDVDRLATAIEDFNALFIRLPAAQRLNFSALSVIHTLSRNGPMRLKDLLATEQIKQPALTSLVSKLEDAGLVSRRPDANDGRAVRLSVTRSGEQLVRSRHADRVTMLTRLTDRLDDHDRVILSETAAVLSRLVEIARDSTGEPTADVPSRPVRRKAAP